MSDKQKVLYLHQYFHHPGEPGCSRSYWFAKSLIQSGFRVVMITQKNAFYPENKSIKRAERKNIDGIEVVYVKNSYSPEMKLSKRIFSFINFMFRATMVSFKEKDVSLVIASSTPLTIGLPAYLLKKVKGYRFIFEVRDLWPDGPIQMGYFRNRLIQYFLYWVERKLYREANHIIALSPGMLSGVHRYVPLSKISMIPNMSKIDWFYPREHNPELMDQPGLSKSSFKVIYFGQIGRSNEPDYIVDAANLMMNASISGINFIFMGSGDKKRVIEKRVKDEKINNIYFIDRKPLKMVSEIVNLCDVSLVTFKNIPVHCTNSPNKFFDSLAAGKPMIVNSSGWTRELVVENNCGFYVDPEKPQDLVDKIIFLKEHPTIKNAMGMNARKLAETTFDKSILCAKFKEVVDRVLM